MKKKILVAALAVSAIISATYAYSGNSGVQGMMNGQVGMMNGQGGMQQGMMNRQGMQQGMMSKHNMQGHMMFRGHRGNMMRMFAKLNLSNDQKFQISILRDEMKLDMKKLRGPRQSSKIMKYVSENGFDKEAFKKDMDIMHQKMLDLKANNMEKIFKILTKEQIAQLKQNISN